MTLQPPAAPPDPGAAAPLPSPHTRTAGRAWASCFRSGGRHATRAAAAAAHAMSRRRLLGLVAASAGLLAVDAWLVEPRWIEVERIVLRLPDLGPAWNGARIVLLSDTHCGPFTSPAHVERAVALANELEPDVVLLLGDYVHRGPRYIAPGIAPFGHLHAREGVFAVLGNHDHWDGRDASLRALVRASVEPLVNQSVLLRRRGDPLVIAGVGDWMEDEQRLDRALAGRSGHTPRIVMSHNPDYAESLPAEERVDLLVSGHTHGGQVTVPGYGAPILPSRFGRKYQQGLVQGPRSMVYVTRGVGTISPPVRLLCRPEITLLTVAAG